MKKDCIIFLKKFLFVMIIVLLYSCKGKVKTTDVRFGGNNGEEVYYRDSHYTGQIWSKDGKSFVFDVSDGRVIKLTIFHDNGQPAEISKDSLGHYKEKYYDINGYEMTYEECYSKYPDIRAKSNQMVEEINYNNK